MPDLFQFALSSPGLFYGQTITQTGSAMMLKTLNRKLAWIPVEVPDSSITKLSLAQALPAGRGVCVFLGQNVVNETNFSASIRRLLTELPLEKARMLWLPNPNDRRDQWRLAALRIEAALDLALVDAATGFTFGYQEVVLSPGCMASVDTTLNSVRISGPIFLSTRNGAARVGVVKGDLTIPLTGQYPGLLQFPLTIDAQAMDGLNIGLRLFYPSLTPSIPGIQLLNSVRYPIFDPGKSSLSLNASLDPLAPADVTRTSFAFQPGDNIPTFYRTNVGVPVSFAFPAGSSGRLVFAACPAAQTASVRDPYYLTPDGPFAIALAGNPPQPPPNLMCGINGAEFVELDATSAVTFASGQSAFLASLPPGADAAAAVSPGPNLSGPTTTSWASVGSAASRLIYSAVPDGAGFYSGSGLRPYFPAAAAFLPSLSEAPGASGSYPLLPYAGIQSGDDFTLLQLLETRVISPQRRAVIHSINTGAPAPAPPSTAPSTTQSITATQASSSSTNVSTLTPQGFRADFSQDRASWSRLQIAQSDAGPLAFHGIGDPLKSALLTNQQFLVITNPASLIPIFSQDNTAEIAGWNFLVDPAQWNQFGTILIIKNHSHSLQSLVNDLSTWTLPSQFNLSPQQAQSRIVNIIGKAVTSLTVNQDFAFFVDTVVNDESWNGLIFLNVKIPLTALPPDLEVLAAGLDPNKFVAHHIGINQTPVTDDLAPKNSSLFGLIDYEDATAVQASPLIYDFRVVFLRVLFHNTAVQNFSAQAALTLNQLFSARATGPAVGGTVVLDGMYETHGDATVFALTQDQPAAFTTNDAVLKNVNIGTTHASTTLPATAASDQVETVFAFWGDMGFQALTTNDGTAFDLFSYSKLSFSNLRLIMAYSQSNPTARNFTFDPGGVSFDLSQSTARDASLAQQFPLKIKGLLASSATDHKAQPVSSGYLSVGSPLTVQSLAAPSYGLEFDLNLGTLGSLAASAGFGASMLLAWSPSTTPGPMFVGLKLPGFTGSGDQASLMGVLKLKMYSLELVQSQGAFMLLLNGISLGFFGITIPPNGTFDFFLFGDPSSKPGADTLGWYGDYLAS